MLEEKDKIIFLVEDNRADIRLIQEVMKTMNIKLRMMNNHNIQGMMILEESFSLLHQNQVLKMQNKVESTLHQHSNVLMM